MTNIEAMAWFNEMRSILIEEELKAARWPLGFCMKVALVITGDVTEAEVRRDHDKTTADCIMQEVKRRREVR